MAIASLKGRSALLPEQVVLVDALDVQDVQLGLQLHLPDLADLLLGQKVVLDLLRDRVLDLRGELLLLRFRQAADLAESAHVALLPVRSGHRMYPNALRFSSVSASITVFCPAGFRPARSSSRMTETS